MLGIGGTFMAGVAALARDLGHEVTGSDVAVYPPTSTQLDALGISVLQGYRAEHLRPGPEQVVVGNAVGRGNPAVEYLLNVDLSYTSGPQWLAEQVLRGRWVLACAGTHGKTTTASMLAWILEQAGLCPGFLIGGVPNNFGVSARLGDGAHFVVEADEYDTAFFDKRSKFVHYHPRTLLLNNLEYDHADIFPDLEAIRVQFHHLVRTVRTNGRILISHQDAELRRVLERGCWTPIETFGPEGRWEARLVSPGGQGFAVSCEGREVGEVQWTLCGRHNVENALAAIAAAAHAGVTAEDSLAALAGFTGVKRRLERRGQVRGVTVYDDFAHHPTAIAATLAGLRSRVGANRLIAVVEPRSNTMRLGIHRAALAPALAMADQVVLYQAPGLHWDVGEVTAALGDRARVLDSVSAIIEHLAASARPGDYIVVMSNGPFEDIHSRLLRALGG